MLSTRTFVDLVTTFPFAPTGAVWFPFASVIVVIVAHMLVVFASAPVLIAAVQLPVVSPFAPVFIAIIGMHMPVEFPFRAMFVVVIAMHVPVESHSACQECYLTGCKRWTAAKQSRLAVAGEQGRHHARVAR